MAAVLFIKFIAIIYFCSFVPNVWYPIVGSTGLHALPNTDGARCEDVPDDAESRAPTVGERRRFGSDDENDRVSASESGVSTLNAVRTAVRVPVRPVCYTAIFVKAEREGEP